MSDADVVYSSRGVQKDAEKLFRNSVRHRRTLVRLSFLGSNHLLLGARSCGDIHRPSPTGFLLTQALAGDMRP